MIYNKQAISVEAQISQFRERGLRVENEEEAAHILSTISYFRFANYLRPFEADKLNHLFKPGKLFGDVVCLYYFDKELRSIVFSAIQTVDFIKSHSDSYIGHFMLDQMKMELDFELVKELAAGFTNKSAFSKSVQKFIETGPQMDRPCCTVQ